MPVRQASLRLACAGAAGGGGPGVGVDEQVSHGPCPDLALGVEAVQPGQVTQPVRAAPGVQCIGEMLIPPVAVADDGAGVAGQDAASVDRFAGPVAGVHRGEELSARHVHVAQFPRRPGGGLVGIQHRGGRQQLPDPVHERRQQPGGLAPHAGHEPGRDVHPGQRGHQPGGAGDRQVVRADHQRGLRVHQRPVLHPPGHPGQRQPDRDNAAFRALLRGDLVLGHRRRRGRRRLEHLPFLRRAQHRLAGQVTAAAAARCRPAEHRVIRLG